MATDVIDLVWNQLQNELAQLRQATRTALVRSERAETAGGVPSAAFADLPYSPTGVSNGDEMFVTNACKTGEGVGTGTGCICYYDAATDTWLRVYDDQPPLAAGGGGGGGVASVTASSPIASSGGANPNISVGAWGAAGDLGIESFGVAAAAGATGKLPDAGHIHSMPANPVNFAVPAIVLGSAAAAGAAGTLIRSDSTIQAFDANNPAASAPGDAAAVGIIAYAARRDHKHAREAWAAAGDIGAETFGASAAAGASGKVADGAHVHALPNIAFIPGGRLTLTSGSPIVLADETAKATLYYTPYVHDRIELYNGATWDELIFAELSIAVPATTNTNYDVFIYNNAGTATLELLAWTNDTTRATALAYQNGRLVKSGAATRLYVGMMRTTGTSGQTEKSVTKLFVINHYNRIRLALLKSDSTSHTYATTTWRSWNNDATIRIELLVGWIDRKIELLNIGICAPTVDGVQGWIGEAVDATNTAHCAIYNANNQYMRTTSLTLVDPASVGYHYIQGTEYASNTVSYVGIEVRAIVEA